MEIRDIAPLLSLVSTLATIAYFMGQLKSVYATREQVHGLREEFVAAINKRERESVAAHIHLATKAELDSLERDLQTNIKELKSEILATIDKHSAQIQGQMAGLLESVTGLASRLTGYIDRQKGGVK